MSFGSTPSSSAALLLGPGHGVLDRVLDLALADDDEACLAGIDEVAEFLDLERDIPLAR